jgi:hypothetical protein
MSYEISIDEAADIAQVTMWGTPTFEEMIEVLAKLTAGDAFITRKRLWDLRNATSALSSNEMERLAQAALARDKGGASRVAIIAEEDVIYGLSRVFEVYRESSEVKVRTFRDLDEAQGWLQEDC